MYHLGTYMNIILIIQKYIIYSLLYNYFCKYNEIINLAFFLYVFCILIKHYIIFRPKQLPKLPNGMPNLLFLYSDII